MTVKQLVDALSLREFTVADSEREITGGYAGDLLSWVMGRAAEGDAWVTIMTNINVVAVASLADVSCVLLAEGVSVPDDVLAAASDKGVTLLGSDKPIYELCKALGEALDGETA
ncbi:MAG: hypothetical protein IJC52_01780 [Clostridia bacterium]|nr:hypothetical protein [Clostridia bacterium]